MNPKRGFTVKRKIYFSLGSDESPYMDVTMILQQQ